MGQYHGKYEGRSFSKFKYNEEVRKAPDHIPDITPATESATEDQNYP